MHLSLNNRFVIHKLASFEFIKVLFGVGFLTLLAKICIPLPFTPVPVTFQTFAVYMLGLCFSPLVAAQIVISYLFCGLFAPVFCGNMYGFSVFCGPTSGYLLAFVPAAVFIASARTKYNMNAWKIAGILSLSALGILSIGSVWLSVYFCDSSSSFYDSVLQGFRFGALPFISGEVLKIGLAVQSLSLCAFLKKSI